MSEISADRWREVERIYHDALDQPTEGRDAWVADACGDDAELRREVESLIKFSNETTGSLGPEAIAAAAQHLAPERVGALVGRRIGGYDVSALLGAGGMGEVYRARELRLGRDVALKILSPSLSGSAGDVRRFEEEARSASVLNHPNIVTIYAVGEAESVGYIAMELVEGRTLRQVIGGQPMPVRTTLDLAVQLVDALAAAHDRGIVHRDLKPDNIMVTPDGRVKVLDFGIAKRDRAYDMTERGPMRVTEMTATREPLTEDGAILGTVGYMSPEQAMGRLALPQSDQFSFGLILYEMLSGHRAFERPSRADTLTAIIREPPNPLTQLGGEHAALRRVIDRCLEKDPGARYTMTRALATDVHAVRDTMIAAERVPGMTRRRAIWLGAGATAAAVAGVGAWQLWAPAKPRKLAILPFANPLKADDTEYLCDGMMRSLIDQLSGVPTLSVIAEMTALTFKGQEIDPRTVGQRLAVDAVVAGSVSRQFGRIFVSAELIDVHSGSRTWFHNYEQNEDDALEVQQSIARDIIKDGLQLSESERRMLPPPPTTNPEAFDAYLQAEHYINEFKEDGFRAAIPILKGVVEVEPKFAGAMAMISTAIANLTVDGYEPPAPSWADHDRWLTRALQIDPELPAVRVQQCVRMFFFDWKFPEVEAAIADVLRSPRAVMRHSFLYTLVLIKWALRRPDALKMSEKLLLHDPLNPIRVRVADVRLLSGDVADAARLYEIVMRELPENPRAYFGLAEARRQQGNFEEAINLRRRALELDAGEPLTEDNPLYLVFKRARGARGYRDIDEECAKQQVSELDARKARGAYASPLDYARTYAVLRENRRAFAFLETAVHEQSGGLVFLNVDTAWIPLRSDPEFAKAVKAVGLPAA